MQFIRYTPFRQIVRAYSTLLGIGEDLRKLSSTTHATQAGLTEIAAALGNVQASIEGVTQKLTTPPSPVKAQIDIHDINGFRLLLDSSSLVDNWVIHYGEWEGKAVQHLMQLAEKFRGAPSPVFMDLGSYWGYYTFMLYSTGIFPRMYAVDADPYNFAQLQANIFLNKLDDVVVAHHGAISDQAGVLMMQSSHSHEDKNRGATRILLPGEDAGTRAVRAVNAFVLDEKFDIRDSQIVIKMDVEGHEDRALPGMRKLLANNKVIMQIELYRSREDPVFGLLQDMGMRLIGEISPDYFFTNLSPGELGQ
jgi:FkbM family methyltransferase